MDNQEKFDLIFLDPPTFSNSKRMQEPLEIQKDHVFLIEHCVRSLSPEGLLIFSNNFRKFKLDEEALKKQNLFYRDITRQTIPLDFEKNPKIHQCWAISKAEKVLAFRV
jgi:23S rRNA (guanine2445-N2)-methyltransferase / 23S rRNA (guanine2069-N7)-methyltransferase